MLVEDIKFLELKIEEMENNGDTQSEEYKRTLRQLAWYKELKEYREEYARTMMDNEYYIDDEDEYYIDDEDEYYIDDEDEFDKVKTSPEAKETLDKLYKGISNILNSVFYNRRINSYGAELIADSICQEELAEELKEMIERFSELKSKANKKK